MNKPVWRTNTKQTVPSDLGDEILYRDGVVLNVSRSDKEHGCNWEVTGQYHDHIAYQTNRTRKAKYRPEKCVCKGGIIFLPSVEGGYFDGHPCPRCNGKGYRLEPIK